MCDGGKAFSGYAADMWAAGVCLYIFVTGKLPFFTNVPIDLLDMIKEAKVPYEGLALSDSLLDLLHMTLEKDPTKRGGVGDCLKHPFLAEARAQRVQQLSVEFAKSSTTSVIVEERDLQSVCTLFLNSYCLRGSFGEENSTNLICFFSPSLTFVSGVPHCYVHASGPPQVSNQTNTSRCQTFDWWFCWQVEFLFGEK